MMDKRPQPITTHDEQGKAIATTHRTLTPRPKSVEELTEQRLQEGHIRFADEPIVPLSVLRLIEHLERTQNAEGVWIDADDCAALAADLRTALCNQALASHAAPLSEDVEGMREALCKAYIAGATDVHIYWRGMTGAERPEPDFSEAASDYSVEAIQALSPIREDGKRDS